MKGSSNAPKILHSNKNLLDNWDFTNPVNQRGQTSYTANGSDASRLYTIDRWALGNNSVKNRLVISDHKISCYLSGLYSRFYQLIPIENTLNGGKKITLSVITENVNANLNLSLEFYNSGGTELYTYDSIPMADSNAENIRINGKTYKLFKVTITLTSNIGYLYCNIINLNDTSSAYSVSLIAAKLEYGEVSTLKNDLLGVSYAEELIKCKRYLYRISAAGNVHTRLFGACAGHNDTLLTTSILMPDNFRETNASPVLEISDISQFSVIKGNTEKAVTGIAVSGASDQSVPLDIYVASGGIDEGAAYSFLMKANSWIQFSKEL